MSNFSSTYPSVSPTYQIDFANGKRIPPNATFSRSDSPIDATKAAASAVHYWSNEKHLSSENLLPYSNNLSSADWTKSRLTVDSVNNTAPDGGSDASLLLETADTGTHTFYDSFNCVSGQNYSFVFYVKPNGRTKLLFRPQATGIIASLVFELSGSGTVTLSSGSTVSHSITQVGDYYKCHATVTATATGAGWTQVYLDNGSGTNYAGDATKGAIFWGCQISSTSQTTLNETSGSIHRAYAPTLKSVATAGQPRFEYDPTDGQSAGTSLGILVESQSSNLIASSEDLTTTWITSRSSVQANAAIAPSGDLTADALVDDGTAANNHNIRQEFTISSTGDHTASLYAKPAGRDYLTVFFSNYGGKFSDEYAIINLTNGSVGTTSGTISASAESVGGGWYRIQATASANSTGTARLTLLTAASSSSYTHDGDSYSGVLIWGVQVEEGAFASSYVQTLLSAKTRAADNLTVDLTQAGYTGGPVSIITETTDGQGSYPRTFSLSDGTITNYANIHRNGAATDTSSDYRVRLFTDGASQVDRTASGSASATKIGMSIDTNSVISTFDGGSSATDSSAVINTMTELRIGDQPTGGKQLNGTCKRIAVYGTALSQSELEALTS